MSWYSDNERFGEFEPSYCRDCNKSPESKADCDRCQRDHQEIDEYWKKYWGEN